MGRRISRFRDRMDAAAERMAAFQAKLFLNLFYILVVPVAHIWLRVTGRLHHRTTGFFQNREAGKGSIEDYLRQH